VEVGKLADLCLWTPANFGTKPSLVIKSGLISYCQMVCQVKHLPELLKPPFIWSDDLTDGVSTTPG